MKAEWNDDQDRFWSVLTVGCVRLGRCFTFGWHGDIWRAPRRSIHGGVLWRFGDFVAQPHVDVGGTLDGIMIHN